MKVYKAWNDYPNDKMEDNDLLDFAINLWRSGDLKVESFWDQESNRRMIRYSINIFQQNEEG